MLDKQKLNVILDYALLGFSLNSVSLDHSQDISQEHTCFAKQHANSKIPS